MKGVAVFSEENRVNVSIYPLDVFQLTDAGMLEIRNAATRLPPNALALMVLMDGKATVGDLEQKAAHLEPQALRETLRALLAAGLIRAQTIAESEGLDFSEFFGTTAPAVSPAVQASAESEAAGGTPKLERQGYYVSIARQAVKAPAKSPLRALVVEDDPDVSTLVARLLEKEGFEAQVVATRDEIVARLRSTPLPDLIILDLNLPGVSGFQVLERLKASAALKAVPVILLTADTARESIVRGLAGGADGYITKPFEKASLITGVRAVLGLDAGETKA